jgi:hypothetical protein
MVHFPPPQTKEIFMEHQLGQPHVFNGLFTDLDLEGAEIAILCYLEEHKEDLMQWLAVRKIDFEGGISQWMQSKSFRIDAYASLQAAGLRLPSQSSDEV